MLVTRVQTSYHQAETIASKRLSQKACKFTVTVGYVVIWIVSSGLRQSSDDLPQRHQTLIDIYGLFSGDVARLALTLATSQVHELQGRNNYAVGIALINAFERESEHWVRPRTLIIHIVAGGNTVF